MKDVAGKILKENLREDSPLSELKKLHGDASYRTYYRAILENGKTYIVMQMPKGRASASEEITNFKGVHLELPFINVDRFLKKVNLPVPCVYHYSEVDHVMIIEDLGDDIMARFVEGADADTQLQWYKNAVELLVRMQELAGSDGSDKCIAHKRSFDATLLNWEFDHFLEYGVAARLGKPMEANDLAIFNEETRRITSQIQNMEYGFTHRDFQSRNIIVKDGALFLIDFQDALMGPYAYDLVALTRDSYVKLPADVLEKLLHRYCDLSNRDYSNVRRDYDIITVQRKLKDVGRFVYIDRIKGNPNFLQYIPASLDYVKEALSRLPEHKKLFGVLKKYIPEWK